MNLYNRNPYYQGEENTQKPLPFFSYWVHTDNQGDISFADCNLSADEEDLNFDECCCLDISSDIPMSQCEQDIIDSFYDALKEEGEFVYLTGLDKTHLEY